MARQKRYSRIRKRTFVVAGLTTLTILLAAALISLYALLQAGPDDLVTITINEGESRSAVLGSGISLETAESSNLLRDASFEPLIFRQTLTVYSGDSTTLTVSSEEASAGRFGDGFFNGAAARVMARTDSGLILKKMANVLNYGINRVGVFSEVNLPDNLPAGLSVLAFTRQGDTTLAVGEQGLIIMNASGQTPSIADAGLEADLTGVCSTAGGYLACSDKGDILSSADGESWQILASYPALSLRAIAATAEGVFVAVGDEGALVTGHGQATAALQPLVPADLHDVVCSGTSFAAFGDNGTIITSQSGVIWQAAAQEEDIDWLAADYRGGRFVAVGTDSAVAVSDDGTVFTTLDHRTGTDAVDIVMLSRRQLIVLDRNGGFAVSNDSGATWLNSVIQTGMKSKVIALAGKDKILSADGKDQLGLAQLVAEIQLDSALKESQYQAGDLIFLEKTALEVPENYVAADAGASAYLDPWSHFGVGSAQRVSGESSPGGGEASLLLVADPGQEGQASIVSQKLPGSLVNAGKNDIYEAELWMKQSDVSDRSVQVWLTGPFEPVGTTFTNVGTTWKKYNFTFILPAGTINLPTEEIRFNVAIRSGRLWIDQTSLFAAADSPQQLSGDFTAAMQSVSPQLIRLDFLGIGAPTSRMASWASALGNGNAYLGSSGWMSSGTISLHAALQMSDDCGADPWLVIDSYASQAELLNLVEFLTGPISEPYGKLRMDQGSVLPWTERFGRVIIEITDSSDVYATDQLKADFVNLMIATISQSPYYRQIKGQLIFVDGMSYQAGVVLSTADYHASDFDGIVQADLAQGLQDALTAYYDIIPRNPEKQVQNWPELMRTARLRANGVKLPTLAGLTAILLADLGDHTALSNLALPARDSQDWQQAWPSAATIASACARGVPLDLTVDADDLIASGFRSDQRIALALLNLSDSARTCSLLTDLQLQGATLYRYDSQGVLISTTILKSTATRLAVLGGGAILIIK